MHLSVHPAHNRAASPPDENVGPTRTMEIGLHVYGFGSPAEAGFLVIVSTPLA
jgi:hypothetical protein